MAKKINLTTRQKEVRKDLIRGNGIVNNAELAEKYKVSRQQIWRDRKAIEKAQPIPAEDWDEGAEIARSINFYDVQIQALADELELLEGEVSKRSNHKSVTGLMANRVNLLREIRQTKESMDQFLLSIGYFKAAPQRLLIGKAQLEDLDGEGLDSEISRLEGLLGSNGSEKS